jgi:transglutaminase-like putative cysteine protease
MEGRLKEAEDYFGNILHHMSAERPVSSIKILVEGDIITFDTNGIITGAIERIPNIFYLRDTPLTLVNPEIAYFIHNAIKNDLTDLNKCHSLLNSIHECMSFDNNATNVNTTAAEAFFTKKGVCQDFVHIFIACARVLNIPACYVSGYYLRNDTDRQTAAHAWAEAYISDLGWISFDPAHGLSPNERYVRLATALDYNGAAPTRGAIIGGDGEDMKISIRIFSPQEHKDISQFLTQ